MYKSSRSKACDITKKVKDKVWQRDNCMCIICKSPFAMPNAHYISRAQSGLGIEENIVTLCQRCHHNYDQTEHREFYRQKIKVYLQSKYPDWDEEKLVYSRWKNDTVCRK